MGNEVCVACGLPNLSRPNEALAKFLCQVVLFKQLPADQQAPLCKIAQTVEFEAGDVIVQQGDPGDDFWVIMQGTAAVTIDGRQEATLRVHDYFGERALLQEEPRTATVTATSKATLVRITRDNFQKFGLHGKLRFAHRKAVGGGSDDDVLTKPPSAKTPEERKLMTEALRKNKLLPMIASDDGKVNQIIDRAWKECVPAGLELITEGDRNADYFYIIQEGGFDILSRSRGVNVQGALARQDSIDYMGPGGSFGELALLYAAPRTATVRASVSSVVWVVDRKNFKEILSRSAEDLAKEHGKYLEKLPILDPLQAAEKEAMAKALTEMIICRGETIFQQGEEGDTFYILIEGEVSVLEDGKDVRRLVASPSRAECFGERSLLANEPRSATICVTSETAKVLTMDRQSFDMLLGPLEELRARGQNGHQTVTPVPSLRPEASDQERSYGVVQRRDLKRIGRLGVGGFGAVDLVEHVVTGETYALKMLSKGYVVKAGLQTSVINEKNVQLTCNSRFVIKLFETYRDEQSLWFLLEPALGGELYQTYARKRLHGSEPHARFYVAGVILAFQHLHSKKVVYRDLKPENLLLTATGHLKMTDMGLCKVVIGKTYTTCGTPDYFAPEMVLSAGHNQAVDWWTLGILAFELMTGRPPFEAPTPVQTYRKVQEGIHKVRFPRTCNATCEDLVKRLCCKNPLMRLPMKAGGVAELKRHPWLCDFSWQDMENLTLQPPYVPRVATKRDLQNFFVREQDAPPKIKYVDDGSNWDKDFATST